MTRLEIAARKYKEALAAFKAAAADKRDELVANVNAANAEVAMAMVAAR